MIRKAIGSITMNVICMNYVSLRARMGVEAVLNIFLKSNRKKYTEKAATVVLILVQLARRRGVVSLYL